MADSTPVTNVIQDPIETVMNGDQKQFYDNTILKTEIVPNYKLNYTADSVYETRNYSFTSTGYIPLKTLVLQIPVDFALYSQANPLNDPFEAHGWADNCLFQIIYQLIIKIGDVTIHRNECSLRRVIKSIVNNGKSDADVNRIRGLWGFPYVQTESFSSGETVPGSLAWLQNDNATRDSFLTLFRSMSAQVNGDRFDYSTPPDGGAIIYRYAGKANLPLPFSMLSDLFDQNARLPPNVRIGVYLRTFIQPQTLGIRSTDLTSPPAGRKYGWYQAKVGGDPSIWFENDTLAPQAETLIREFRMNNRLCYNFSDYEEKLIVGNGPLINVLINVQQQYPTEIIIRLISLVNELVTDRGTITGTNGAQIPVCEKMVVFPESLCSYNDIVNNELVLNSIGDLRFVSSGEIIYQYRSTNDNLKFGNIIPSAQDWIFANYNQKNSFIKNLSSVGELKGPFRPITCTAYNSELRFIFTPGGSVQCDQTGEMMKATNLRLEMNLQRPLPEHSRLQIILRKPAQLLIGPDNKADVVVWPEMVKGGEIYELNPMLAS